MDKYSKTDRMQEYRRLCEQRGERCTKQRLVVLESVLDLDNHPSADQIFDVVSTRIPGIARTTVYRALEHLARVGIITKACHPGHVARFDPRIEIHHHLVCLHCNELTDFEDDGLDGIEIPDTSASDFEVIDHRVQLRGICKKCRDREKKEETK